MKKILFGCLAFFMLLAVHIKTEGAENVKLYGTRAEEWTRLLTRYNQSETTWLGADGMFSVALNGNDAFGSATENTKTFFIFSDTILGVSDAEGYCSTRGFVNHSSAILTGNTPDEDNIRFVWGKNGSCNSNSNFLRKKRWCGDCLVVGDYLYIMTVNAYPNPSENVGAGLATIPIRNGEPVYGEVTLVDTIPQLNVKIGQTTAMLSSGFFANTKAAGAPNPDGYIYMYGNANKNLVVARIPESDFPDFTKLTYWDGTKWSNNPEDTKPFDKKVSDELSVTPITVGPYAGKYILIFMGDAGLCYAIGDSPYGPFDESVVFYNVPENGAYLESKNGTLGGLWTYHAKAHPHLSDGSRLLVSYNVNSTECLGGTSSGSVDDYHPRFVWLELDPENAEKDCYEYTVEYYYDGVLWPYKTYTEYAEEGSIISSYPNKRRGYGGDYVVDIVENLNLVVGSDVSNNIIKVYYKSGGKTRYTIEYYYDGMKDEASTEVQYAKTGDVISTYTEKAKYGYVFDRVEGLNRIITGDASANVVKVYYKVDNTGDVGGNTGDTGGSTDTTGDNTGDNNEDNTGDNAGDNTGDNAGDSTDDNTGDTTGDNIKDDGDDTENKTGGKKTIVWIVCVVLVCGCLVAGMFLYKKFHKPIEQ